MPKTPKRISQKAHAKPAARDAHCVSLMTPLFCEKVVFGGLVKSVARNELKPSARMPADINETPMSMTATPVTTVGNIFLRSFAGLCRIKFRRFSPSTHWLIPHSGPQERDEHLEPGRRAPPRPPS